MKPGFLKGLKLDASGLKAALQDDLARVDEFMTGALGSDIPYIDRLGDEVFRSSGKRLRPALVILAAGAPGESNESTITAGGVVEMIHTATLLHDDVVDASELRRGRPTLNARFGDGPAILMADYIYSRAITLLVEAELTQVLSLLAWTVHKMSIGELLQLELKERGPLDREAYFQVIYEKTARLIEGSCRSGAILGGRNSAEIEALGTYGRSMGLSFQIVDDILDYQSDEETLGKPVGSDLSEGKQTLPLLMAYESGDEPTRGKIRELLGDREALPELVNLVRENGGLEAAMEEARRLGREAQKALETLPKGRVREALEATASFVTQREF